MRRFGNIARRVVLVLLAALLGLAAYHASAAGIARNDLPMPFGVGLATVESNSMRPAFSRGDLLVVRRADDIETGDVVVYRDPTIGLVVHRVVALDGELVTTQGDANNTADTPFDRNSIVGSVALVLPAMGTVVEALRSPLGVVALIAVLLAVVELPMRRRQDADERHRDELRLQIAELKRARSEAADDEGSEDDGRADER